MAYKSTVENIKYILHYKDYPCFACHNIAQSPDRISEMDFSSILYQTWRLQRSSQNRQGERLCAEFTSDTGEGMKIGDSDCMYKYCNWRVETGNRTAVLQVSAGQRDKH